MTSFLAATYTAQLTPQVRGQAEQVFRMLDKDNSNSLTADEIVRAFSTPSFTFPLVAAKALIRSANMNGFVSLQDFYLLDRFISHANAVFQQVTASTGQRMDVNGLMAGLASMQFALGQPACQALLINFDKSRTGNLEYSGFLAIASLCCLNKTLMGKFDTTGRGVFTLNFEQMSTLCLWYI